MKRSQIIILVFIGLSVIGGAGYWGIKGGINSGISITEESIDVPQTVPVSRGDVLQTIIAPGQLENYSTRNLFSNTTGSINEIYVRAGDSVEEGQLLISVDDSNAKQIFDEAKRAYLELLSPASLAEAEENIAHAKAESEKARQSLAYLISPSVVYWELILDDAKFKLSEKQENYDQNPTDLNFKAVEEAKKEVESTEGYLQGAWWSYENEYIYSTFKIIEEVNEETQEKKRYVNRPTADQIMEARASFNETREKLKEAEFYLEALQTETIPQNAYGSKIIEFEKALTELQKAELALQNTKVFAPFSGTILKTQVTEGDYVYDGNILLQIADPHALEVLASVVEEEYPLLEIGQQVDIFFDADPDVNVSGEISRIIPSRVSNERPLYQFFISLHSVPEKLVEGMTADASIILNSRTDVLRLPRSMVQASSSGTAVVSIWENNHIKEIEIETGLRGDTYIEILSGLEEGQEVIGQ